MAPTGSTSARPIAAPSAHSRNGLMLGISARDVDEATAARALGAAYIGAGPVWTTPTKPDAGLPIGIEALAAICAAVDIPVVAIGGVDATNAAGCITAGAAGVAVVRAAADAASVRLAVDAALAVSAAPDGAAACVAQSEAPSMSPSGRAFGATERKRRTISGRRLTAMTGFSMRNWRKLPSPSVRQRSRVVALTLAVRDLPSSAATSPKKSPARRWWTTLPSMMTSASPSRMMKKSGPESPSVRMPWPAR